jgi:hypothetical protein
VEVSIKLRSVVCIALLMIGQTTTLRSGTAFLLRPPSIESFVADNTPEHRFARLSLSVSAQAIIISSPHRRN